MRIVFTLIGNSRRSGYLDGHSMRYGGVGGSGTDTSTILVAEYLASQGHEVVVTLDKLEPHLEKQHAESGRHFDSGRIVNGVQYCDLDFTHVENKTFDVLINSLWLHNYDELPITVTRAVIYWCHMQWIYGIDEVAAFAKKHNLALGFVHISNWEKSMNEPCVARAAAVTPTKTALIPNPEPDDVIRQVLAENIARKPHKFVFHAAWPRGGDVAIRAIRELPWLDKELHAFDYLMVIHAHGDEFFYIHNGVDKLTLYRHLAEAEYFVYPLYTPYQDVHKDTFSCVVADAIALGCTPITYPLGALPENFEGYCHWLPFPEGIDPAVLQTQSLTKDIAGDFKSPAVVQNIVNAILQLEQSPELKDKVKQTGAQFILDRLNTVTVGQQWVDFLDKLTA